MKKYLVIGNPIEHSLSPKLHNYWIKQNNINATYEKKLISENDIRNIVSKNKSEEIGINVTVPFKNKIVPFVDILTKEADETKSINTIYFEKGKIIGHNTDIAGFELGIRSYGYDIEKKKCFHTWSRGSCSIHNCCFKKNESFKYISLQQNSR